MFTFSQMQIQTKSIISSIQCQIESVFMLVRLYLSALQIGGLADEVDEAILHAAFIPFGVVKEVTMPIDAGTGKRRGYGFLEFEEMDDAAEARDNMNSIYVVKQYLHIDAELFGKVIRVGYSKQMKGQLISSKPSAWFFNTLIPSLGSNRFNGGNQRANR